MTRIFSTALAIALGFAAPSGVEAAGYKSTSIPAEHRGQDIPLHIWYPTEDTADGALLGQNAVFEGYKVQARATPSSGAHPLVILSHGSGGNALNIGWIASFLADQGMIVAATNHPGTTSGNSTQAETMKIWQRPADVSAIIDHFEAGAADGLTADLTRIGAVGFSLGAYTVLGSAGARVSKQAFIDYCDAHPTMWDCSWYARGGVDLNDADQPKFEQSNLDPRIAAVVSIDSPFALAYDTDSLSQMSLPVAIVNLGASPTIPIALAGAEIAPHLPNAELTYVEGAHHFSFLGTCTPNGQSILDGTDEGPLCIEVSARSRSDIHQELETYIAGFLKSNM